MNVKRFAAVLCFTVCLHSQAIDREARVTRHNIELREADPLSPLSLGNGQVCFTADVTGLQSFEQDYAGGIPLGTLADWAWHSFPDASGFSLRQTIISVDAGGRKAGYPLLSNTAGAWLRANPHRFTVGRVGLSITRADGAPVALRELKRIRQRLDLWRGLLISEFEAGAVPVRVETVVHPSLDAVAARVESPLLAAGRIRVFVDFPYPNGAWGPAFNDWTKSERHATSLVRRSRNRIELRRELDGTRYGVVILHQDGGTVVPQGAHRWQIHPSRGAASLRVAVTFAAESPVRRYAAGFDGAKQAAARYWPRYWRSGGAVDLSSSKDPRWRELERRIVLSEYLEAIQSRGKYPPQETGLTCNSWHGKFHLEMHWWHSAHWPLWGRAAVLEKQLAWYGDVLPVMRATARSQGYDGARWGKMLGPDGRESPSSVGPLLIWQQPHPIYFAELLYRQSGDRKVLDRYRNLVFETAAFMASYPVWDEKQQHFNLGPPLLSAREFSASAYARTRNAAFELAYWRWGLRMANEWRRRLDLPPDPRWQRIADHLAPLPTADGIYIEQETPVVSEGGHPAMLGALGFLPSSPAVDPRTMTRTLEHVMQRWPKRDMWGWDFPLTAMTAARLGRRNLAVDALLLDWPKNRYLANGHNFQQLGKLPLYLPGNGGLLTAIAMMAAGWDGGPREHAPGFPSDGSWVVRWENLRVAP